MGKSNEQTITSISEGEALYNNYKIVCEKTHDFMCTCLTANGLVDNTFNVVNVLQIIITNITAGINDKNIRLHIAKAMNDIFASIEDDLDKKKGA